MQSWAYVRNNGEGVSFTFLQVLKGLINLERERKRERRETVGFDLG